MGHGPVRRPPEAIIRSTPAACSTSPPDAQIKRSLRARLRRSDREKAENLASVRGIETTLHNGPDACKPAAKMTHLGYSCIPNSLYTQHMETNREERNILKVYAITYSYPTTDRYYRGQRGIRVEARNEAEALRKIQRGHGGYMPCPDARIVRAKVVG